MIKRVLVTGGTGFIGQHVLTPLIKRGYEVHVTTTNLQQFLRNDVVVHQVNLLNHSEHSELMSRIRPTHWLHAAWYTKNGKFWDAIENIDWLQATLSMEKLFYSGGGSRILGIGSCAEYDWTDGVCIEDQTIENPASLYGKIKKSAYECLKALCKSQQVSFAWARIFFPYGAGESENRLIPYVINNLLRDQEARCTHGNQFRDFLHVYDIGEALAAILDSDFTGLVNVGSGISVTIKEVIERVALILDRERLVLFGEIPEPAYSPPKIIADISLLKQEIGWSASLSLNQGILDTINWWRRLEITKL